MLDRAIHLATKLTSFISQAGSVLLWDPLQSFSLWIYLGVAVAYTALVFHGEFSKQDGPMILSKRNCRSISSIVSIHLGFLALLFLLMRCCILGFPYLPNWMTASFVLHGTDDSALDILYMLLMIVFYRLERKYLYVDSAADGDGGNDAAETPLNGK